jgi:hypothetical protein
MVQRLADGIRLGVRTRIEIINQFSGRLSAIYAERRDRIGPTSMLARNFPVGRLVTEALEAITAEARANGLRSEQPPPNLFPDPKQQAAYEQIRTEGVRIWEVLKETTTREDAEGSGKYYETEKLLRDLKGINERYLELAVPHLNHLLASEN